MKREIMRLRFILDLWGTLNYYKGIDKLTFADWIYKRRLSLRDAIIIANIVYSESYERDHLL